MNPRPFHLLLTVCLVAALAGCAGDGPSAPIKRTAFTPLPDLSGTATRDLASLPWTLSDIDSTGVAVTLSIPNGLCHDIKGVQTEIGPSRITLTVLGTTRAGCHSRVTVDSIVAVRLPEPLATRELSPAPTPSR